jgi:hypothetical protein
MVLNPVWMAPYLVPPSIKPADPTWLELLQNETDLEISWIHFALFIGVIYFWIFWVSGILKKRHCRCFWRLFHHYLEENGLTTLDICKLSRVSTWFDRPWQSWQAGQVWVAWLFPRAKDVLSLLSFIAMWEEHGKYASVCGLDVGCCEKMYYNGSGFKSLGRDIIRPQIWHSTFKLFCLEEVIFLKPGRPWHIVLTTSQRSRAHTHTPSCSQTWCYSTEVGRVG